MSVLDAIDLVVCGFAIYGLHKYVFKRPLVRPRAWRYFTIGYVAWSASSLLLLMGFGSGRELTWRSSLNLVLEVAFICATAFALYRYSFKTEPVSAPS